MGAYDQAIAAAQRALALATIGGDIVLQALANQYLGRAYHAQGDYRRAIDCFEQTVAALEGARRLERFGQVILPTVLSRAYLARFHAELGMFAEGHPLVEEGLRIAQAADHPLSLMVASWSGGLLALRQGDLARVLPRLERAVSMCQDADHQTFFPLMAAILGAAYTLSGRIADAVPLLTQAMEQTTATEMAGFQALCRLPLSEAQLVAGLLEEAHTLAEALGMRPLQAHCHRVLGTLYTMTGQREQARAELSTAIEMYRAMEMTFWLPEAERALTEVEERGSRALTVHMAPRCSLGL
jgi:tetratricopeptide (TPR) repeat protein